MADSWTEARYRSKNRSRPSSWEYAASGQFTNPYDTSGMRIGRGYLGYTQEDLAAMGRALSGRGSLTELGDPNLLSTETGNAPRFLSRVGYHQYMNDPGVAKYRKHLEGLQHGALEDKLKAVSREQVGRAQGAQRQQQQDAFSGSMGGGYSAPGVGQYLNRKMDIALAGDLGEAYRQAAVADIDSRTMAGQGLVQEALTQQNLLDRIIAADTHNIDVQLQKKAWDKQPSAWKQFGMDMLGKAIQGGIGYATGGLSMPGLNVRNYGTGYQSPVSDYERGAPLSSYMSSGTYGPMPSSSYGSSYTSVPSSSYDSAPIQGPMLPPVQGPPSSPYMSPPYQGDSYDLYGNSYNDYGY